MTERNDVFEQIRVRFIQHFHPLKMYLFGSRANGSARSGSDYDIVLVVRERTGSRTENMVAASRLVQDLGVSVDVFVYTETEFQDWKDEINSIPETAISRGREILIG